ncbi:MAG: biotin carboxylase N-terminal domain-containing protein [Marmoricola sp.]
MANRGEIARRVFASCRRLGIETVAVHSDADAGLPFVREADAAVRLPGSTPAETYLRGDLVIDAARRTGADAVHPGYGFLSENAGFAAAVLDAGLIWLGPSPEAIEAMGSKVGAKKLMAAAGVPVLEAPADPTDADLPLLVKASAGGGGRGMRIVRTLADLPGEIAAAQAEAESAFGDGTVFVEPYVERGRHVEVQVVGDRHGRVLVLGERDCSIQRRHQKVVEEAPAPSIGRDVVEAMHTAARRAAESIGYVGAGTVEFLHDPSTERFFFLEMNTRLQVEHPVTEAVYGVDLVELQIAVAEGAGVDRTVPEPRGHAIEVRLYAEDPANEWAPQSGLLHDFEVPGVTAEFGRSPETGVRLDSGYESGSTVSTYYDAMLAKVIAWAPSRREAARLLADALTRARLHGPVTNRDLLVAVLRDEAFVAGDVSTDFLQRRPVLEQVADVPPESLQLVAAAAALARDSQGRRTVQQGAPLAWRNVVSQRQRTVFGVAGQEHAVEWYGDRDGFRPADGDVRVLAVAPGVVTLEVGGVASRFDVRVGPAGATGRPVWVDSRLGSVALRELPRFVDPAERVSEGSLLAPMPGTVVAVAVAPHETVTRGQPVLVLEAMKMQHNVTAPADGVVARIDVETGDQVAAGTVLAVVDPQAGGESP